MGRGGESVDDTILHTRDFQKQLRKESRRERIAGLLTCLKEKEKERKDLDSAGLEKEESIGPPTPK